MGDHVKYAIKLWSYTASRTLIIILGRCMEIARAILNSRLLLVIWVIWDTSDLLVEQKNGFMCFITETRILFVCLEDISGSLISNLRVKGLSYALTTFISAAQCKTGSTRCGPQSLRIDAVNEASVWPGGCVRDAFQVAKCLAAISQRKQLVDTHATRPPAEKTEPVNQELSQGLFPVL
jgi:hypothetical protein